MMILAHCKSRRRLSYIFAAAGVLSVAFVIAYLSMGVPAVIAAGLPVTVPALVLLLVTETGTGPGACGPSGSPLV